jgi:branched-subunit amino acid transport protein
VALVTAVWVVVALVGLATMAAKAAGTLLVGGRTLPPRVQAAMEHLAPALLAALVVTQALGGERGGFAVDARLAGLAAAAVAVAFRAPLLLVVTIAAATAATARALG